MDMVALPFLASTLIDGDSARRSCWPRARSATVTSTTSTRDQACATAGVPTIKYNMSLLGVLRTGDEVPSAGVRAYGHSAPRT